MRSDLDSNYETRNMDGDGLLFRIVHSVWPQAHLAGVFFFYQSIPAINNHGVSVTCPMLDLLDESTHGELRIFMMVVGNWHL
jgi:hypothetical protein